MVGCEGLAAKGLPGTGVVSTLSSLHTNVGAPGCSAVNIRSMQRAAAVSAINKLFMRRARMARTQNLCMARSRCAQHVRLRGHLLHPAHVTLTGGPKSSTNGTCTCVQQKPQRSAAGFALPPPDAADGGACMHITGMCSVRAGL